MTQGVSQQVFTDSPDDNKGFYELTTSLMVEEVNDN